MYALDYISKIAPIFTAAFAVLIAYQVHKHNKRRDKEAIREKIWAMQQSFNLECVKNPDLVRCGEIIFVGDINRDDAESDISRAVYVTFIQLNRSRLLWDAWN